MLVFATSFECDGFEYERTLIEVRFDGTSEVCAREFAAYDIPYFLGPVQDMRVRDGETFDLIARDGYIHGYLVADSGPLLRRLREE